MADNSIFISTPDKPNIRGALPGSDNVYIRTYLQPVIIGIAQGAAMKAFFKRNEAEWKGKRFKTGEKIALPGETFSPVNNFDKSWWLGSPVTDVVMMGYPAHTNDQGESVPAGGIVIQNLLMTVKMSKNIVSTTIPGHRGDVKQFISDGDYVVDVVGLLAAPPANVNRQYSVFSGGVIKPKGEFEQGVRPTEEIMAFIRTMRAQIELDVYSPFLNLFDIGKVVIYDFEMPQQEGKLDNQMFKFKMRSDEPFDVIINV